MSKFCKVCDGPLPKYKQKFCSDKCFREWRKEYSRKRRQNNAEKIKEYGKKYRQNNAEKIKERQKEYRQNNPEKERERAKKYRQNNPEKERERAKKYRQNNAEKIKEYGKKHRQNNAEKIKERQKKHRQNNPEKIKEYRQNNREEQKEYNKKQYRHNIGLPEDADLTKISSLEYIMEGWFERWFKGTGHTFLPQHYIDLRPFGGTNTTVDVYIPEIRLCYYADGWHYHYEKILDDGKTAHEGRDPRINKALKIGGYKVTRDTGPEIRAGVRPWEILEMLNIPLPPEFEQQTLGMN